MTTPQIETRNLAAHGLRVRRNGSSLPKVEGVAVKWGSLSEDLGGWRERFARGAFRESLKTDDIRVVWQHDTSRVFGRVRKGTADAWEDAVGLQYEATPPDAQWARDAIASIRRGDVDQNSFRFWIADPDRHQRFVREGGVTVREVLKARLVEVGPQTVPAYPDTKVALRSIEAARREGRIVARSIRKQRTKPVPDCSPPIWPHEWRNLSETRIARATALHEAAHAVLDHLTGAGIEAVWIEVERIGSSPQVVGGRCRAVDATRKTTVTHLAGIAAEIAAGFEPDPDWWHSDLRKFNQRRKPYETERDTMELAKGLVTKYGKAINALASALLEKRYIAGDEATALIEAALPLDPNGVLVACLRKSA